MVRVASLWPSAGAKEPITAADRAKHALRDIKWCQSGWQNSWACRPQQASGSVPGHGGQCLAIWKACSSHGPMAVNVRPHRTMSAHVCPCLPMSALNAAQQSMSAHVHVRRWPSSPPRGSLRPTELAGPSHTAPTLASTTTQGRKPGPLRQHRAATTPRQAAATATLGGRPRGRRCSTRPSRFSQWRRLSSSASGRPDRAAAFKVSSSLREGPSSRNSL